jgi:hypothetical protein
MFANFATGGNFGIWRRWKMSKSSERTKIVAYIRVVLLSKSSKATIIYRLERMAKVFFPKGEVTISEEPCGGEFSQFAVIHVNVSGDQLARIEEIKKLVDHVIDMVLDRDIPATSS